MKKVLSFLLVLVLLAGLSVCAHAEEVPGFVSGDYEYTVNDDGTAAITKYAGFAEILEIPAELDGHPVSSIGAESFYEYDKLTSVTIPDGVTSIGEDAFLCCDNLTIKVAPGSFAEQYAKDNQIPFTYIEDTSWLG